MPKLPSLKSLSSNTYYKMAVFASNILKLEAFCLTYSLQN